MTHDLIGRAALVAAALIMLPVPKRRRDVGFQILAAATLWGIAVIQWLAAGAPL